MDGAVMTSASSRGHWDFWTDGVVASPDSQPGRNVYMNETEGKTEWY